jgi:hypothetical protein
MWCDAQFAKFDGQLRLDESRQARIESAVARFVQYCQQDEQLKAALAEPPFLQGSVPNHTVIKPIGNDEYDVDVIYPFRSSLFPAEHQNPGALFRWFVSRIQLDGWYKGRTTVKNRCVRVNYAGDFHIDIIPSTREVPGHQPFAVPARDLQAWIANDPRGMESWVRLRDAASGMTDARGHGVLVRCIRSMKRWRDQFFGSDPRPSSILLTTILGKHEASRQDYNPPLQGPMYPANRHDAAYLYDLLRLTHSCLQVQISTPFSHPTIIGEDLRHGWDREFTDLFMNRLAASIRSIRQALDATTESEAVRAYKAALGETFPGA